MRNNFTIIYNFGLVVGDSLALLAAFTVAYILRVTISHRVLVTPIHAYTYLMVSLTLLPFWVLIFALLGLYSSRHYENRFSELGRLIVASFIGILFAISYSYIANVAVFPARLVAFYDFILAAFIVFSFRTVARLIVRELFSYGVAINYVLLVGDTKTTHILVDSLANTSLTGYSVVGVVGGTKHPIKSNSKYCQFKSFVDAINHIDSSKLHTIIQTELYANGETNDEILTFAQEHHISYRFVPGNDELFTGNIQVDLFHSVPIITVHQTALVGWGRIVKRFSDIILSIVLIIVSSPLMLTIALVIKLSDGGPIVYKQKRLSRFDTTVLIYKFRSFKKDYNGLSPEEAFIKMNQPELVKQYRSQGDQLVDDPRVSLIGKWLRKRSLDELPQLFNVLRGDISLVGPRALVSYELDQYAQKNLILSVKSGLTGLAQISGRRDISFDERRKLDLYYVQNWSFSYDLVILVKTIWIVIFQKGAI